MSILDFKPQPWADSAACASVDSELFFPEASDREGRVLAAKAICRTCPVQLQCLQAALEAERNVNRARRYGIFGGLTPTERARLDDSATCTNCGEPYPKVGNVRYCSNDCKREGRRASQHDYRDRRPKRIGSAS